jgi:antitoxin VapB
MGIAQPEDIRACNHDIGHLTEPDMPLYIKDDATVELVAKLAKMRGVSKQDAVRLAVQAELERMVEAVPLRERIAAWRKEHPMPPPTGQKADKAFFDDWPGEL